MFAALKALPFVAKAQLFVSIGALVKAVIDAGGPVEAAAEDVIHSVAGVEGAPDLKTALVSLKTAVVADVNSPDVQADIQAVIDQLP